MNFNALSYFLIFILIFFDFLFFNISVTFINITLIRVVMFGLFYIYFLTYLKNNKIYLDITIKRIFLFFGVWFFNFILSLLWALNKISVFKATYYFILFTIMIFLIVKLLNSEKNIEIARKAFIYLTYVMIIIGVLEIIFNIHFSTSRYSDLDWLRENNLINIKASTGTFYNENDYALFLSIGAPFLLYELFKQGFKLKILNTIFILLTFFLIIKNNADLVLITLIFEIGIFLTFINISNLKKYLLFFMFTLVSMIYLMLNNFIIENFLIKIEQLSNGFGSTFIRFNLYKNGLLALLESKFLGVGAGGFQDHIRPDLYTGNIINPHNWWIELITEHGLLIFIGFIIVYASILINLFKIYKSNSGLSPVAFIIFISLFGLIIGSVAPSSFFYYWPMWHLIGIALAVINVYKLKSAISR